MRSRSIGARLVGLAAGLSLLTLAGAGLVIARGLGDFVAARFLAELDTAIVAILADVEPDEDGEPVLLDPPADPRFFRPFSGWYWQVALDGTVAIASTSLDAATLDVPGEAAIGPRGEALRVLRRVVEAPGFAAPLEIAAAAPEAEIDAAAAAATRPRVAALALLGLGLTGAIALQARLGLAPLRRLTADLARVREGRIESLPPEPYAEIAPVVAEVNALVAENRVVAARARAHLADLSHALKTPLSVVANALKRGDDAAGTGAGAAALMERLIRRRLGRARAAARPHGAHAAMDAVIEDVTLVLGPLARERGLRLKVAAAPDAIFAGEAEDAAEMIGPLLENACRWARAEVRVEAARVRGRLRITIEDDGPGMSEADAARALRRGERLDAAGPGHGLGLSIAEDLAGLYGGGLALGRSTLGGLAARLDLPAAPGAAPRP
jgi:signal transduction histidine kinase